MRGRTRKLWLLVGALALAGVGGSLFGCAGIAAVVRGSHEYRLEQPVFTSPTTLSSHHRGEPATAKALRRALGEPNEVINLEADQERWTYRADLRFHGVALLLVVVPIPLLLPTGVHEAFVEIEEGQVTRIWGTQNATLARFGCMVGPIAALSGDRGCFADSGSSPTSARLGSAELWLGPPPRLVRDKALDRAE